jgi:hypothetical protein
LVIQKNEKRMEGKLQKEYELWLEVWDTPHTYSYPLIPQSHFLIGHDQMDEEIRLFVSHYLSRKFRPQEEPPDLRGLSVFVCSPTPILKKSDLRQFFVGSYRGYIQTASWPDRGLQDANAERVGYVAELWFTPASAPQS